MGSSFGPNSDHPGVLDECILYMKLTINSSAFLIEQMLLGSHPSLCWCDHPVGLQISFFHSSLVCGSGCQLGTPKRWSDVSIGNSGVPCSLLPSVTQTGHRVTSSESMGHSQGHISVSNKKFSVIRSIEPEALPSP